MSAIVLQRRSRFAKAARGWPSSANEKPSPTIRVKPGKGIFFAALMTDLADPPTDHVQRITATKTSTPIMTVNDHGIVAETVGANKNYTFPKALNNKPSELTLFTRFKMVAAPTISSALVVFTYSDDPAPPPYTKVAIKHSSSTAIRGYFGGSAIDDPFVFTLGKWYTYAVTTKDGHSECWVDGVSRGSIASGGGSWGTDPRIIIGEDYGSGRTPGHQTSFVIGFDRVLTEGEIIAYSKDPWGELTEPANQSPFLISVPAGGGVPTLSLPGVTGVQATQATPQVTLTF